ncbi:retrovirus-related pol polyprotein from transposon TNT 1-94 [Tanacetum coccineum]|uniref:RING-type E3 ubiquitin transferase n=1 Tax=Tanacetum coccineum TaxID=301880 RepID=A0ABQ5DGK9_9ASTR
MEHLQVSTLKTEIGGKGEGEKEEIDTCAICYGEYEESKKIGKLQCGHLFHVDCLISWLSRKNSCPMCRASALTPQTTFDFVDEVAILNHSDSYYYPHQPQTTFGFVDEVAILNHFDSYYYPHQPQTTLGNPLTIAVSPVLVANAPRAVDLADSPVSTSIDQGCSSTAHQTQDQEHSPIISQGFEESPKTPHFHDDPLHEFLHEDSTSQESSSNMRPIHTPFNHLARGGNRFQGIILTDGKDRVHLYLCSNAANKNMPQLSTWTSNDILKWRVKKGLRFSTEGSVDPDKPIAVYMAKKGSLRSQTRPRAWYDMLSSFLISQHFSKGAVDPTLFTRKVGNDLLLVPNFVDDIIFASLTSAMAGENGNSGTLLCSAGISTGRHLYKHLAKITDSILDREARLFTSRLLNAACKKSLNLLKKGLLVRGKLRQLPNGDYRDGLRL